jgi:hypothetical protein
MPTTGEPGSLTMHFTSSDFPSMADEVEAGAREYQQLFGKRPNFVFIHCSIGMNLEPHLEYNFFNRNHQVQTRWHNDTDKSHVIFVDSEI